MLRLSCAAARSSRLCELFPISEPLHGASFVERTDDASTARGVFVSDVSTLVDTAGWIVGKTSTRDDCNCTVLNAITLDVLSADATETFILADAEYSRVPRRL